MNNRVAAPEIVTQCRVIGLLRDKLGYEYLGNRQYRENNSNIEEKYLRAFLQESGYSDELITRAIEQLHRAARQTGKLYDTNKEVYNLLRYGAPVEIKGRRNETVKFINWQEPDKNHFAVAEEVTLKKDGHERRPDVVLYVNGIALAVLELKKSSVMLEDGIRQNISNQKMEFNRWFFTTAQFLLAGNDSQGLRYGTIGTQEKNFLRWKEDDKTKPEDVGILDWELSCICKKERFLDLIYNFVLFDGGIKKLPRPHQYFAVKAAQKRLRGYEGGIIWHTQGSGKSLVMVLLAQWILENIVDSRVLIITDRRELEDQINAVFANNKRDLKCTKNGRDLFDKLEQPEFSLLSTLVHKFGNHTDKEFTEYRETLEANPPTVSGNVFVLVDECHRTESGRLHRVMKQVLSAHVFVGFTGTPLLREDKETSADIFGRYIHIYQYDKAVADGIVLDLIYQARDIEQTLASPQKVDEWFEAKTEGLTKVQKQMLRERWATLRNVLSSQNRIKKIVMDVMMDFNTMPRLKSEKGTAMLVTSEIREACAFYREFAQTGLHKKCAVITSYNPQDQNLTGEDTGEETETDKQMICEVYREMFDDLEVNTSEACEKIAKEWFIKEPARMRLLIVVDKLLTGFDAPSCTYLYLDKNMRDHGLFQAICRTNRPDGEDKEYGVIIDYKDLFRNMQEAITVYTSELDGDTDGRGDANITIQKRLTICHEKLEKARQQMASVLENVEPPKTEKEYIAYFCGTTMEEIESKKDRRTSLYKAAAALLRAYANIADDMRAAGYDAKEIKAIKQETEQATDVRNIVRLAAGEYIDTKPYEADMRYLINNYIEAGESRTIANFSDIPLIELNNAGIDIIQQANAGKNKGTARVIIANNIRIAIKKARAQNPAFYDSMSKQLEEILKQLHEKQIDYEEFLRRIKELEKDIKTGMDKGNMPQGITTSGQLALYNYFNNNGAEDATTLALLLYEEVNEKKQAGWQSEGNQAKENRIKGVIGEVIEGELEQSHIEPLFDILYKNEEFGD